ncbi:hypothetical protein KY284_032687 [Solanum tuberosum]|nr:hypothetical protein KY284_032687 [Solanum tuberosum]
MMHSFGLSERATWSERHYKFANQRLSQLCEELDKLPYEVKNDNIANESNVELNTSEQRQNTILIDPLCVVTKGRPNSLRMKGGLKKSLKVKKCSSKKQTSQIKSSKNGKAKDKGNGMSSSSNVELESQSTSPLLSTTPSTTPIMDLMRTTSYPYMQDL